MIRIINFMQLRRNNLSLSACWRMSGLGYLAKRAKDWASYIVLACCCLYLMSDAANAIGAASDNKSAATIRQQQELINGMTKIMNACLSDSTGLPVQIGNEIYLCGIVHVGPAQ